MIGVDSGGGGGGCVWWGGGGDPRVRCIQYRKKLAFFVPKAAWRARGKAHGWRVVVFQVWFLDLEHLHH